MLPKNKLKFNELYNAVMKIYKIILSFLLFTSAALHAQTLTLSLERTISLAADSSLEAFRTKNMYLAGYWQYRTFKAGRLPSLTLNLTPAQYYRDITKRYNYDKNVEEYRTQQSFYASGNLRVKQNFDLLGGTFFLDSDLGYMRNFGENTYNQFTTIPIRIGYSQDLLGYNPFRWERKIEPLKYEIAKKELLYNIENISEQATTYFFQLAMAQAEYDLAKENVASTDSLYRQGRTTDLETGCRQCTQHIAKCRYSPQKSHVQPCLFPQLRQKYGNPVTLARTSERYADIGR